MRSLGGILGLAEANEAKEGDGPVLREDHQEVQHDHQGKPQDRPEPGEVFPRKVDFLDAASAALPQLLLAQQEGSQSRAMAVLRVGQSPSLFFRDGECVVVLLAYRQDALRKRTWGDRRAGPPRVWMALILILIVEVLRVV